ncbi:barstar family protein [Kitasatospora mediocidica]|uniref:barstar family protein n=1 Tax=Kitasatospora mediocidica TaxID=58352 RepID=UPI000AC7663E|nr:barstar family protein [Kitasatospora mediocidica]
MLVEDGSWGWDRSVPLKYVLLCEDDDGVDRLWGRCADVDGLFVDPVPPPRERLTLLACAPGGALRTAIDRPGPTTGRLGDLCVEVGNGERPLEWWMLLDVLVVAHRPSAADPSLVDVVIEAGVEEPDHRDAQVVASPRFELFGAFNSLVASGTGIDGLRVDRPGPPDVPMGLVGCEPTELLTAELRRPRGGAWVELWRLDRTGRPIARRCLDLRVTGSRPSVHGDALVDLTLADGVQDPPPLLARPIWETWAEGIPQTPNLWARYATPGREEWQMLALALFSRSGRVVDLAGGTYHLDGSHVTDVPGLHCAMSEALLGPGGYYGWGWDAFADCLCGGFGVVPPFTLVWHDAQIAREALADVISDPAGEFSYFEDVVRHLEQRRVTVVLR